MYRKVRGKDNYVYEVNKSSTQCSENNYPFSLLNVQWQIINGNWNSFYICIMLILSMTLRSDSKRTFSTKMCLRVWGGHWLQKGPWRAFLWWWAEVMDFYRGNLIVWIVFLFQTEVITDILHEKQWEGGTGSVPEQGLSICRTGSYWMAEWLTASPLNYIGKGIRPDSL